VTGCKPRAESAVTGDAASRVYVAPGKYDEFYNIVSGGFNGQIAIYGIPSGRLFRIVPVFSQSSESGYGYSEETKPMLNTSHGFVPWDDLHHIALSETNECMMADKHSQMNNMNCRLTSQFRTPEIRKLHQ
jgi:nitrous-oxide reductase